jgi:thiamine biosynthesis lipoprotein
MCDIRVLPSSRVGIARRVAIDLGGIAKGFAVDRAIDVLREYGCSAGEVNAGGDLRVFGPDESVVWIRARDAHWPIRLRDGACAVSEGVTPNRPCEHRGYYRSHATNAEATNRLDWIAVTASSAMWADALTTYAMVCDNTEERAQFRSVLARHDARELLPSARDRS